MNAKKLAVALLPAAVLALSPLAAFADGGPNVEVAGVQVDAQGRPILICGFSTGVGGVQTCSFPLGSGTTNQTQNQAQVAGIQASADGTAVFKCEFAPDRASVQACTFGG